MIAMTFTIELDIGLSLLLQAALPQLVTDRETKTHRRRRVKRSYGHCRRRTEIPEAEPLTDTTRCPNQRLGTRASRKTRPVKVPDEVPHKDADERPATYLRTGDAAMPDMHTRDQTR
jgi:hypothetical protein